VGKGKTMLHPSGEKEGVEERPRNQRTGGETQETKRPYICPTEKGKKGASTECGGRNSMKKKVKKRESGPPSISGEEDWNLS